MGKHELFHIFKDQFPTLNWFIFSNGVTTTIDFGPGYFTLTLRAYYMCGVFHVSLVSRSDILDYRVVCSTLDMAIDQVKFLISYLRLHPHIDRTIPIGSRGYGSLIKLNEDLHKWKEQNGQDNR